MEEIVNNELEFYSKIAKPLVLNLPKPKERLLAAAWIRKFRDEEAGPESLRVNYLKLLLFTLQRRRLIGIFSDDPENYAVLDDFPSNYNLATIAKELIEEEIKERKQRYRKELTGDIGDIPPYVTDCSPDLLEYVAAQDIPNFGVHAYYAISKDPINKWHHPEKAILPKGVKSAIDTVPEPLYPPPASRQGSPGPPSGAAHPSEDAPPTEDAPPAEEAAAVVPSTSEPSCACPHGQHKADCKFKTPEKKKKSKKRFGRTPPTHPLGAVLKEDDVRLSPTWGSNLLEVKEVLPDSGDEFDAEDLGELVDMGFMDDFLEDRGDDMDFDLFREAFKDFKEARMDKTKSRLPKIGSSTVKSGISRPVTSGSTTRSRLPAPKGSKLPKPGAAKAQSPSPRARSPSPKAPSPQKQATPKQATPRQATPKQVTPRQATPKQASPSPRGKSPSPLKYDMEELKQLGLSPSDLKDVDVNMDDLMMDISEVEDEDIGDIDFPETSFERELRLMEEEMAMENLEDVEVSMLQTQVEEDMPVLTHYDEEEEVSRIANTVSRVAGEARTTSPALSSGVPVTTPRATPSPRRPRSPERGLMEVGATVVSPPGSNVPSPGRKSSPVKSPDRSREEDVSRVFQEASVIARPPSPPQQPKSPRSPSSIKEGNVSVVFDEAHLAGSFPGSDPEVAIPFVPDPNSCGPCDTSGGFAYDNADLAHLGLTEADLQDIDTNFDVNMSGISDIDVGNNALIDSYERKLAEMDAYMAQQDEYIRQLEEEHAADIAEYGDLPAYTEDELNEIAYGGGQSPCSGAGSPPQPPQQPPQLTQAQLDMLAQLDALESRISKLDTPPRPPEMSPDIPYSTHYSPRTPPMPPPEVNIQMGSPAARSIQEEAQNALDEIEPDGPTTPQQPCPCSPQGGASPVSPYATDFHMEMFGDIDDESHMFDSFESPEHSPERWAIPIPGEGMPVRTIQDTSFSPCAGFESPEPLSRSTEFELREQYEPAGSPRTPPATAAPQFSPQRPPSPRSPCTPPSQLPMQRPQDYHTPCATPPPQFPEARPADFATPPPYVPPAPWDWESPDRLTEPIPIYEDTVGVMDQGNITPDDYLDLGPESPCPCDDVAFPPSPDQIPEFNLQEEDIYGPDPGDFSLPIDGSGFMDEGGLDASRPSSLDAESPCHQFYYPPGFSFESYDQTPPRTPLAQHQIPQQFFQQERYAISQAPNLPNVKEFEEEFAEIGSPCYFTPVRKQRPPSPPRKVTPPKPTMSKEQSRYYDWLYSHDPVEAERMKRIHLMVDDVPDDGFPDPLHMAYHLATPESPEFVRIMGEPCDLGASPPLAMDEILYDPMPPPPPQVDHIAHPPPEAPCPCTEPAAPKRTPPKPQPGVQKAMAGAVCGAPVATKPVKKQSKVKLKETKSSQLRKAKLKQEKVLSPTSRMVAEKRAKKEQAAAARKQQAELKAQEAALRAQEAAQMAQEAAQMAQEAAQRAQQARPGTSKTGRSKSGGGPCAGAMSPRKKSPARPVTPTGPQEPPCITCGQTSPRGSPASAMRPPTQPSGLKPPGGAPCGMRPPGSGIRPPGSGLKPPAPCGQPPSSGIRPPGSGIRPPGSGIKPPGSGIKPPGPCGGAQTSGLRPPGSGIRPPGSGIKQPGPCGSAPPSGIRPPGSGIKPPAPCGSAPASGIKPPGSGIRPPGSGIKPPGSGIRPPGSGIKSPCAGGSARPPTASQSAPCASAAPPGLEGYDMAEMAALGLTAADLMDIDMDLDIDVGDDEFGDIPVSDEIAALEKMHADMDDELDRYDAMIKQLEEENAEDIAMFGDDEPPAPDEICDPCTSGSSFYGSPHHTPQGVPGPSRRYSPKYTPDGMPGPSKRDPAALQAMRATGSPPTPKRRSPSPLKFAPAPKIKKSGRVDPGAPPCEPCGDLEYDMEELAQYGLTADDLKEIDVDDMGIMDDIGYDDNEVDVTPEMDPENAERFAEMDNYLDAHDAYIKQLEEEMGDDMALYGDLSYHSSGMNSPCGVCEDVVEPTQPAQLTQAQLDMLAKLDALDARLTQLESPPRTPQRTPKPSPMLTPRSPRTPSMSNVGPCGAGSQRELSPGQREQMELDMFEQMEREVCGGSPKVSPQQYGGMSDAEAKRKMEAQMAKAFRQQDQVQYYTSPPRPMMAIKKAYLERKRVVGPYTPLQRAPIYRPAPPVARYTPPKKDVPDIFDLPAGHDDLFWESPPKMAVSGDADDVFITEEMGNLSPPLTPMSFRENVWQHYDDYFDPKTCRAPLRQRVMHKPVLPKIYEPVGPIEYEKRDFQIVLPDYTKTPPKPKEPVFESETDRYLHETMKRLGPLPELQPQTPERVGLMDLPVPSGLHSPLSPPIELPGWKSPEPFLREYGPQFALQLNDTECGICGEAPELPPSPEQIANFSPLSPEVVVPASIMADPPPGFEAPCVPCDAPFPSLSPLERERRKPPRVIHAHGRKHERSLSPPRPRSPIPLPPPPPLVPISPYASPSPRRPMSQPAYFTPKRPCQPEIDTEDEYFSPDEFSPQLNIQTSHASLSDLDMFDEGMLSDDLMESPCMAHSPARSPSPPRPPSPVSPSCRPEMMEDVMKRVREAPGKIRPGTITMGGYGEKPAKILPRWYSKRPSMNTIREVTDSPGIGPHGLPGIVQLPSLPTAVTPTRPFGRKVQRQASPESPCQPASPRSPLVHLNLPTWDRSPARPLPPTPPMPQGMGDLSGNLSPYASPVCSPIQQTARYPSPPPSPFLQGQAISPRQMPYPPSPRTPPLRAASPRPPSPCGPSPRSPPPRAPSPRSPLPCAGSPTSYFGANVSPVGSSLFGDSSMQSLTGSPFASPTEFDRQQWQGQTAGGLSPGLAEQLMTVGEREAQAAAREKSKNLYDLLDPSSPKSPKSPLAAVASRSPSPVRTNQLQQQMAMSPQAPCKSPSRGESQISQKSPSQVSFKTPSPKKRQATPPKLRTPDVLPGYVSPRFSPIKKPLVDDDLSRFTYMPDLDTGMPPELISSPEATCDTECAQFSPTIQVEEYTEDDWSPQKLFAPSPEQLSPRPPSPAHFSPEWVTSPQMSPQRPRQMSPQMPRQISPQLAEPTYRVRTPPARVAPRDEFEQDFVNYHQEQKQLAEMERIKREKYQRMFEESMRRVQQEFPVAPMSPGMSPGFRSRVKEHDYTANFFDPDRPDQLSGRLTLGRGCSRRMVLPRNAPSPGLESIEEKITRAKIAPQVNEKERVLQAKAAFAAQQRALAQQKRARNMPPPEATGPSRTRRLWNPSQVFQPPQPSGRSQRSSAAKGGCPGGGSGAQASRSSSGRTPSTSTPRVCPGGAPQQAGSSKVVRQSRSSKNSVTKPPKR